MFQKDESLNFNKNPYYSENKYNLMQDKITTERIKSLQEHLKQENPLLVSVVDKFIELDQIGLGLGVLDSRDSYTTEISWWPLISILGTFSAGKSSFINQYVVQIKNKRVNRVVFVFDRKPEPHGAVGCAQCGCC